MKHDHYNVADSINQLLALAELNNDDEVVKQMKLIIPEYISNNSVYELMDDQILSKTVSS